MDSPRNLLTSVVLAFRAVQETDDEVEIDFDTMDTPTLRKLQKFVKKTQQDLKKEARIALKGAQGAQQPGVAGASSSSSSSSVGDGQQGSKDGAAPMDTGVPPLVPGDAVASQANGQGVGDASDSDDSDSDSDGEPASKRQKLE